MSRKKDDGRENMRGFSNSLFLGSKRSRVQHACEWKVKFGCSRIDVEKGCLVHKRSVGTADTNG